MPKKYNYFQGFDGGPQPGSASQMRGVVKHGDVLYCASIRQVVNDTCLRYYETHLPIFEQFIANAR